MTKLLIRSPKNTNLRYVKLVANDTSINTLGNSKIAAECYGTRLQFYLGIIN